MVLGGQLPGRVDGRRNPISFFHVKSVMVGMAQLVSAPDCGSGGRGFESHYPPFCGSLAQLVEHWTFNPGVPGSSPG